MPSPSLDTLATTITTRPACEGGVPRCEGRGLGGKTLCGRSLPPRRVLLPPAPTLRLRQRTGSAQSERTGGRRPSREGHAGSRRVPTRGQPSKAAPDTGPGRKPRDAKREGPSSAVALLRRVERSPGSDSRRAAAARGSGLPPLDGLPVLAWRRRGSLCLRLQRAEVLRAVQFRCVRSHPILPRGLGGLPPHPQDLPLHRHRSPRHNPPAAEEDRAPVGTDPFGFAQGRPWAAASRPVGATESTYTPCSHPKRRRT